MHVVHVLVCEQHGPFGTGAVSKHIHAVGSFALVLGEQALPKVWQGIAWIGGAEESIAGLSREGLNGEDLLVRIEWRPC